MIDDRRGQIGAVLVGLAVVLFVLPALFPVQPVLFHDTGQTAPGPPAEHEADGTRLVAYENLSDRGKQLYRRALEGGGEYRVPQGEGAPGFEYPTASDIAESRDDAGDRRPGQVVVKRPVADDDLPPSDERFYPGRFEREGESLNESEVEQRRQQVLRYDLMQTRTGDPPLNSPAQLLRLGAVLLAVLSLCTGGYLLSSP
jgi:hypothetical protein